MKFFRSLLFLLLFYFFTLLLGVMSLPLLVLPNRFASRLGVIWARIVNLCLGIIPIGFFITGEMCKSEQVIYAVKHQSAWETLILYWQLDKPVMVVKKELLSIPIVGLLMKRAGCIAVDRNAGMSALKKMKREAALTKKTGRSILIFPQGTRVVPTDSTTPYQIGTFSLYQTLSLPVVPVALDSGYYWPKKTFLKNAGIIEVIFLKPIKTGLPKEKFMSTLVNSIEESCNKLKKEEN